MFEKLAKYLERMGEIFEEFLVLRLEGKDIRLTRSGGEPQVEETPTPETNASVKEPTKKKGERSVK